MHLLRRQHDLTPTNHEQSVSVLGEEYYLFTRPNKQSRFPAILVGVFRIMAEMQFFGHTISILHDVKMFGDANGGCWWYKKQSFKSRPMLRRRIRFWSNAGYVHLFAFFLRFRVRTFIHQRHFKPSSRSPVHQTNHKRKTDNAEHNCEDHRVTHQRIKDRHIEQKCAFIPSITSCAFSRLLAPLYVTKSMAHNMQNKIAAIAKKVCAWIIWSPTTLL